MRLECTVVGLDAVEGRGQGGGARTLGGLLMVAAWLLVGCGETSEDRLREGASSLAGGAGHGGRGGAGGSEVGGLPCDAWQGDLLTGTVQSDELMAIVADPRGGLLVAGYEAGITGTTNIQPSGDARGIVRKVASDGSLVWEHRIDTPGTETVEDLAVSDDGASIYALGRTSGALAGANQGKFDLFVRTLDGGGAALHTLQLGNERPQHPRKLSLDPAGGLVVAGYDDIYVPTNYVAAWQDPFVLRLSPAVGGGNAQALRLDWWHQDDTSESDVLLGLGVDVKGDIFVSGSDGAGGESWANLRKLAPDGTLRWVHQFSSGMYDAATSVAVSPGGDLFVAGATFRKLGAAQFGQQDVFVVRVDAETGVAQWITQAGWETSDYPMAMTFDAHQNLYIAGTSTSLDGMDAGVFAMKLSPSGELVGTWRRDSPAFEEVFGAAVDTCGRLFVVGYTEGELIPGKLPSGERDGFVMLTDL
ncbi:hypothetical protein [Chondromyces crocatus]|uniref:Uncharacterized protein n=1 Tax=Chondromyces crocatus TaxID=52 RepID=A0A0K1E7B5_CHOCO|nr:hypothetical protein [Chondromyces crocatus]AKT36755.1 uncharacterized protein CMC5_008760 [Chondromyces crocatus]